VLPAPCAEPCLPVTALLGLPPIALCALCVQVPGGALTFKQQRFREIVVVTSALEFGVPVANTIHQVVRVQLNTMREDLSWVRGVYGSTMGFVSYGGFRIVYGSTKGFVSYGGFRTRRCSPTHVGSPSHTLSV
jgi:hypothetical protein